MLERILANSPVFLLIAVRCFAMVMTLPLFSIRNVSRISKIALTGYMAYILFPHVDFSVYAPYIASDGALSLPYIMLLVGEGLIGLLTGFYVTIIFAAFSSAGQFFAFQMGFSASEVYDALSQVENPLMGQFFNLVAMLIFLQSDWALLLFSKALVASFDSLNAISLVIQRESIVRFLLGSLTKLFADAFLISLPIMGTLLLISVTMGILSKAAPQMNLMSEGFPIMILVSFFIIWSLFPQICEFFIRSFSSGFSSLQRLFVITGGGS
ncbi:flagellar biosynthetic protein FliR [uncultured Treponema sp.]|uniref:flagellar biosynthetic protein FliR n=1 Tax=uncultured Treponema sp. TaxID=162155 RepID=UPI0025E8E095|nr:flagellar biosynthetic protein FliR [uncultured Treponema sp.]